MTKSSSIPGYILCGNYVPYQEDIRNLLQAKLSIYDLFRRTRRILLILDCCLQVLSRAADDQAGRTKKRGDYRRLAELLQWMKRYQNGRELSVIYAQKDRETYPRKSAMLDELNGL